MDPTVSGTYKKTWLRYLYRSLFNEKRVRSMKKRRLHLYTLDVKYVRDLANADNRVMSVSPQQHKENRPFVGIIIIMKQHNYCIPMTSPKPKHNKMKNDLDFSKILDSNNCLIGALNFNNMIPVSNDVIQKLDIRPSSSDTPNEREYKELLNNQLDWCNDNIDNIIKKANKLYRLITQSPEKSINLTRRCCDFKKLEAVLERRLAKAQSNEYEPKEKAVVASAEIPVRHPVIIRRRKNTGRSR